MLPAGSSAVGVNGTPLLDEADASLVIGGIGDHHKRGGVARLLVESPGKLLPWVLVFDQPSGLSAAANSFSAVSCGQRSAGILETRASAEIGDLPTLRGKTSPPAGTS